MSFTLINFESDNTITLSNLKALNEHTFICNNLPNSGIYKLKIENLVMSTNSIITFKIILNNQYPIISESTFKAYISEVYINDELKNLKFHHVNDTSEISHYIIQEFIVKREIADYIVLSKVSNLNQTNETNETNEILSVNQLYNPNHSYYDISYGEHYTNVAVAKPEPEYGDRNFIDISLASPSIEITDFDKFIINLYDNAGDLLDTSGNEESNQLIKKSNVNTFKFSNLSKHVNYIVKIHPVINNNNNYTFNFDYLLRLKEIHFVTAETVDVLNNIINIQYKCLDDNEYSSIDLTQGIRRLDTSTDTIHKFQITTPNMYKHFKIILNSSLNIINIILKGDV